FSSFLVRPPLTAPPFPYTTLFRSLLLAVGDSATAARTLDAPLDSLVALHTAALEYIPLAGCLVRMMALRADLAAARGDSEVARRDRKSTRLNSSHEWISYAVFCLK